MMTSCASGIASCASEPWVIKSHDLSEPSVCISGCCIHSGSRQTEVGMWFKYGA